VAGPEPERELIRRISPFAFPAAVLAFMIGWLFGGAGAAWSAAIAIAIVYVNFLANALSLAWAAGVSPTLVTIVGIGGYAIRLMVYTIALVLLNQLSWFSPVAFALTLVPAITALLIYEAKAFSGRMQADLWTFEGARRP
jgi:ATP synthase protein I